jgi:hypothetical protein
VNEAAEKVFHRPKIENTTVPLRLIRFFLRWFIPNAARTAAETGRRWRS